VEFQEGIREPRDRDVRLRPLSFSRSTIRTYRICSWRGRTRLREIGGNDEVREIGGNKKMKGNFRGHGIGGEKRELGFYPGISH